MRVSFVVVPAILGGRLPRMASLRRSSSWAKRTSRSSSTPPAASPRSSALVALARGEVHLPLRTIVRPPGDESLIGLMPVHRGGEERLYGLKTVVVVPDNSARGLDPHQGTVTLFDGETGQTVAVVNATPITAIRTAAASALATRELARKDARTLAIVGAGFHPRAPRSAVGVLHVRRHSHRLEDGGEDRGAGRATSGGTRSGVRRGGPRGADVITTVTAQRSPSSIASGWQTEPTSTRSARASRTHASSTRPRSPPRRSSPTAASLQRTSRATTAWPSRRARSRTITSQRSWATCSSARTRAARRRTRSRSSSRWASRSRTSSPPSTSYAARGRAAAASPQTLIPIDEIRRAADVIAGGALRTPLVRAQLPDAVRALAQARMLAAGRRFQDSRSAGTPSGKPLRRRWPRASSRRAPATWGRQSRGRPATQASAPRSSPPTTPRAGSWRPSTGSADGS